MSILKALDFLKSDIKLKTESNNIRLNSKIFENYGPISKGRVLHFYGHPDCGKTTIAKDLVESNHNKTFIYISNSLDDINSFKKQDNCLVMISNVFEMTLDFLSTINKEDVDIILIDNLNNMTSKEELESKFNNNLNNKEFFNNFIKKISQIAAQKKCSILLFNGINLMTNKSKYSYIVDEESIATFEIDKLSCNEERLKCVIKPIKNLMNNNKMNCMYTYDWNYKEI